MELLNSLYNLKIGLHGSKTQQQENTQQNLVESILINNGFALKRNINECENDGLYFIIQPNGSQKYPDLQLICVIDKTSHILNMELKSGKDWKIMWNDGYPRKNTIYIFTSTTKNKTLLLDYDDLITDDEMKDVIKAKDFIREINEKYCVGRNTSKFRISLRNNSSQNIRMIYESYQWENKLPILYEYVRAFDNRMEAKASMVNELEAKASMVTAISLFAGAGGDTQGMIDAKINVIGFIEIDEMAIATHIANHPSCVLIGKDVRLVNEELTPYIGTDIIFGGFPCQSFSHGGKKSASDPRGELYKEFIRITNIIKPKVIIGENVKGLLKRQKNDEKFIDLICEEFKSIGYTITYRLVDCTAFNIPQKRERVIIVGVRNDIRLNINIPRGTISSNKTLMDIVEFSLDNAIKITDTAILVIIPNDACLETDDTNIEVTGKPPTNLVKSCNNRTISFRTRSKSIFSCIVDLDGPTNTILCTYARMPRLFVPLKYMNDIYLRPFTILELQRLQGFPDSYQFKGSYVDIVRQIGNAIPPKVVKVVCRSLLKQLSLRK